MANKVRRGINNGLLGKATVCDANRLNTTKTVQSKEIDKNNKFHF